MSRVGEVRHPTPSPSPTPTLTLTPTPTPTPNPTPNPYPGLLLLYTSTGHAEGIEKLAELARKKGKLNIAFICAFLRGNTESCLQASPTLTLSPPPLQLLQQLQATF